ncbi:MAG: HEAT repeat domain-containing protein [Bacteroidota bacterium]|nr:HEAT repeat domain-containing protein [Bacteroidota bacterium]
MKHTEYEEFIQLYLMDELEDDKKIILLNHLKECKECTAVLQENNNLIALYNVNKLVTPSDTLLNTARLELKTRIRMEQSRKSFVSGLAAALNNIFIRNYKITLGYAFTLMAGLIVGTYLLKPQVIIKTITEYAKSDTPTVIVQKESAQSNPLQQNDKNSYKLKNSFANTESRGVPDSIKANVASGLKTDEKMKNLFTYTLLNSQNAGQKLNTINMISNNFNGLDTDVEDAIISVAKNDENPGVRKEALDLLRKYKYDDEVKKALFFVLKNDSVSGLRIAAMLMLAEGSRNGGRFSDLELNVLREKTTKDNNSYVRMQALAVLKEYK